MLAPDGGRRERELGRRSTYVVAFTTCWYAETAETASSFESCLPGSTSCEDAPSRQHQMRGSMRHPQISTYTEEHGHDLVGDHVGQTVETLPDALRRVVSVRPSQGRGEGEMRTVPSWPTLLAETRLNSAL